MSLKLSNLTKTENVDVYDNDHVIPKNSIYLTTGISINGNAAWEDAKNDFNFTGNGTLVNPYIIRDFELDGQDSSSSCISITNSDVYFQIENCTLYDASYGIKLSNVENALISNVTCFDFNYYQKIVR